MCRHPTPPATLAQGLMSPSSGRASRSPRRSRIFTGRSEVGIVSGRSQKATSGSDYGKTIFFLRHLPRFGMIVQTIKDFLDD